MTTHQRFHSFISIGSALLLGMLGCGGGGGGGGESFLVSGLWSVAATGPASANPSDSSRAGRACSAAAAAIQTLPATQINVVQQDGTATANEVGSDLAFTGTVNEPGQSFTLTSTTPICSQQGACQVCGAIATEFLNAAGNNADVNVTIFASGNAACPVQCNVSFPTTTAARS